MGSRLVNVRLDEERLRKARVLREQGLPLSDVIREAIDARFEQLNQARQPRDYTGLLQKIFELHPDPPDLQPRGYDVHHRSAARAAILTKLKRRLR